MATTAADLAREYLALGVPDPWRAHYDAWADARRLSPEVRRAVVVAILRQRVYATERYARRR